MLLFLCMTLAIYQKMDTSVGLSTIASLSLGLSMSMAGSGREVICRNFAAALPIPTPPRPPDGQRSGADSRFPSLPQLPRSAGVGGALQAGFAGPQRRTSFVGILHQMSAQNKLLSCQQNASTDTVRRLSANDVDQVNAGDQASTTTASQDVAHQDTTDDTPRRTSDEAPCFSVDNTARTSHAVTGDYHDVITSRDQCEYTVKI